MSIYYDEKRKSYLVQVMVHGVRIQRRVKTKNEAKRIEAEIKLRPPTTIDSTLGEWLVEWLVTYKKPAVSTVTYKRYVQTAAHLSPLSHYKITELPSLRVQQLYNELNEKLSDSSVNKVHKILKASLTTAYELGYINKPPLPGVKSPQVKKPKLEIFTKEEITIIKESLSDSNIDLLYLTLMVTGARPSELLALRPMAVRENSIYICESKKNLPGQVFGAPKTEAGERELPIPPALAKKLRQPGSFVFHTSNGTAYSIRYVERYWKRLLERAGLPHKRLYALRHTFATLMLAELPVNTVAILMGHQDASVTLNRYGHNIPGYEKIIEEKVTSIYGAV